MSAWVLLTIPAIVALYALMIVHIPRLISTGLVSFRRHASTFSEAMGSGAWSEAGAAAVQVAMLVLPTVGATYVLARTAKRLGKGLWTKTAERPAARTALGFATGLVVIAIVAALWPDADYRPIRRDERGTLADATKTLARKTSRVAPTTTRPSSTPDASPSPTSAPADEPAAESSRDATASGDGRSVEQPTTAPDSDPTEATPDPAASATPSPTPTPAP